jgi:hypothetical protein
VPFEREAHADELLEEEFLENEQAAQNG